MGFVLDPHTDAFREDPYPTFAEMREREPISHQAGWGLTFFTRHGDVQLLLRDRRLGRDIVQALGDEDVDHPEAPQQYPTWRHFVRRLAFIEREPPDHTRLRALVARAFTRRRAEQLRPAVAATAEELLAELGGAGTFDLIADYAEPIPLITIAELLDIPHEARSRLVPWSHDIVQLFEPTTSDEMGARAETATVEFAGFIRELAQHRRRHRGDDLISALVEVEEEGERLSEDELIATCILLLNAGHEATVHAIGNGLLALLRHPDQMALLRSRPDLIRTATEELLRFDTPLQMFERWVLEDFEWKGHLLQAGEKVAFLMGAANRDPERFEHADTLDVTRTDNPHVSFGGGVHLCLGLPLARIELDVAYQTLLQRLPQMELVDPAPPRRDSFVFRGITSLPVRW